MNIYLYTVVNNNKLFLIHTQNTLKDQKWPKEQADVLLTKCTC